MRWVELQPTRWIELGQRRKNDAQSDGGDLGTRVKGKLPGRASSRIATSARADGEKGGASAREGGSSEGEAEMGGEGGRRRPSEGRRAGAEGTDLAVHWAVMLGWVRGGWGLECEG